MCVVCSMQYALCMYACTMYVCVYGYECDYVFIMFIVFNMLFENSQN